jgi:hypothetical protein
MLLLLAALPLFFSCQNATVNYSDNEILYRAKCSSCHNLIEPVDFEKATWWPYIQKYGQEMKSEEKQRLLNYLSERE